MMLNVQELTARLSMMADPALQQYAALHKDDPYVLALAVSEANRRRQIRAAQQGVAGMQPQPTVADQEVAQMTAPVMPEQVGIGALPAPALAGMPAGGIVGEEEMEPQTMAGGGMVAFRDGGDVERYQSDGLVRPKFDVYERWKTLYPQDKLLWGSGPTGYENRPISDLFSDAASAVIGMFPTEEGERQKRARAVEEARMEALMKGYRPRPTMEPGEQEIAYEKANLAPTVTAAKAAQEELAAKTAASANAPGAPKPPAAPTAATPALPGGLGDLNTMFQRALTAQKYEDPAKRDVEELGRKLEEGAKGRLKAFDEYVTKTGDIFKGREERIGKRETELTKQKDTNTGLAFLNAGLAIMSTPGGLATAIGKGARVGTEQFASGLEKIRAAQERLDDARDKLDELKVNRADMTFKERQALQADIDKSKAEAIKLGIEGTRMAAGVTEKRASDIVGNQVRVGIAQFEQAGAGARAQAQINATLNSPDRVAFMAALQGTVTKDKPQGDPVAAYQKLMELKREPISEEKLRADWNKMETRMQIQQDYPNVKTFEDYKAVMNLGGGGGSSGLKLVGTRPSP